MSQKQSYAIVPRIPTGDMVQIGQCYVGLFQVFTEMVKAAPPPPEQVLSDSDLAKIHEEWLGTRHNYFSLMRAIERAVLAKFTEPK